MGDASRAALGLGPGARLAEIEAAFRARVRPLAGAAANDPAASEALRDLIEARAELRRAVAQGAVQAEVAAEPARPPAGDPAAARADDACGVRPLAFRLSPQGRDVAMELSLDALVAAAEAGALSLVIAAPVLRRCTLCAGAGRGACAQCGGSGVTATQRMRRVPLDLERLAAGDFAVRASPWDDAMGRGALGGPLLRAVLV